MIFDELYQEHYEKIYRFCYRFTGDAEQAADLCQDTFLKLFHRLKIKSAMIENPQAWLYKVSGNLCINAVESRNSRHDLLHSMSLNSIEDLNPELALIVNENRNMIRDAIEKLEPKLRMLILMYQDGLSYKEMAEATEISFNSVGKTLWRTIDKLSETIKKQDYEYK